jgi:uncharacterized membrane protein YcaP (DUF421 family)
MESVIRGAAIYAVLLVVLRLSGRRTLAQMTPFDLVLLLIVAEAASQALLGEDFSITNAVILIVTLVGADIALSYLKRAWPLAGRFMDGTPTILVTEGRPDARALARSRVELSEVLEAARLKQGLTRLEDIRFAVLEAGGDISIIPIAKTAG